MSTTHFDLSKYVQGVGGQIRTKLEACDKLYLELTGDLIDQSSLTSIIPDFKPDTYKMIFAPFKYEMEIFLTIKAQDIIDNRVFDTEGRVFIEFLELYIKRIENKYGLKPHLVINLIDIEKMYDKVFSFEQKFQKLGYRVREKYKIKAYSYDIQQVISEDGFGNDDHIPTNKKLIVIAGLTPECGKLATAIAQIYLDQELDINANYAKLEVLPNYSLDKEHPLNILARKQYLQEIEGQDFDTTLNITDLYDRGLEKHHFIQKAFLALKKPIPSSTQDYLIGQLNADYFDKSKLEEKIVQLFGK
ncbi:hypothetical protein AGMMS50249_6100 [candidate division SR1 bacterium]|nr:hypothetical protein AGMMS50249_6100 [candidate division SR1 bacterium]